MVKYICQKCNKEFKQKCHYINHVEKKKNPCILFYKNLIENVPIIQPNAPTIAPTNTSNSKSKSNYVCNYCQTTFTRSTTLKRHLVDRCKIRKEETKDKEEIFKNLLNKYEEMKQLINKYLIYS